jgi:hypothetical protein
MWEVFFRREDYYKGKGKGKQEFKGKQEQRQSKGS